MPLRPPSSHRPKGRITKEWRQAAPALGEDPWKYAERWRLVWEREALDAAERLGGWEQLRVDALDDYVRHLRLAEYHRRFAERDPYVGEGRQVRAHPGWALSLAEQRMAKDAAVALGHRAVARAESLVPAEANGTSGGLVDSLVGEDGEAL